MNTSVENRLYTVVGVIVERLTAAGHRVPTAHS